MGRPGLGLALAALARAAANEYRLVFTQVDIQSTQASPTVSLSEVQLLGVDGEKLSLVRVENPGGTSQRPSENADRAIDGDLTTKWLDMSFLSPPPGLEGLSAGSILLFTLSNPSEVAVGYRLYTAPDAPHRDPISWIFQEGSSSEGTWLTLHSVNGFRPPVARSSSYLPASEAFWVVAPPPAPPRPEYRLVVTATRDIPRRSDSVAISEIMLRTIEGKRPNIYTTTNPNGIYFRHEGPSQATDQVSHTQHDASPVCDAFDRRRGLPRRI